MDRTSGLTGGSFVLIMMKGDERITMRKPIEYIGVYEQTGAFGRVIPDGRGEVREILILQGGEGGAKQGDRVVAALTPSGSYRNIQRQGDADRVGRVTEVLGAGSDLAVAEKALIRRLGLRQTFSEKQLAAARALNRPVAPDSLEGRPDLRAELLVTIDGEDTRDIDDAVSLRREGENWLLGVHIADVSHYVKEGSLLDREAYARGTSIYFPDMALPMLPPDLSNGICSLNQGEDRLAVSCRMTLNRKGVVTDYQIQPTVIRVRERLSYPQVQGYLNRQGWSTREALAGKGGKGKDGKDGKDGKSPEKAAGPEHRYFLEEAIGPMMIDMARLSLVLRENRLKRGALDFELPECKITPGPAGKPCELKLKKRMLSEMVIEELMIIANETVASHYRKMGAPFPYRIHETPEQDRVWQLQHMLGSFGVSLRGTSSHSYQNLLAEVKGKPEESVVSTLLLRSMAHASYSAENRGHFGLASPCYCHFTSPIRRYPDLMAHRVIKLMGKDRERKPDWKEALQEKTDKQCLNTSSLERMGEDAERKADALWKADHMSQYIGLEFDGVINGVTDYGLYVSLENTAEGMVHISRLDGYYEYVEDLMSLISRQNPTRYRLGDPIRVLLESVDIGAGYINFRLPEGAGRPAGEKVRHAIGKKAAAEKTEKAGKANKKADKVNMIAGKAKKKADRPNKKKEGKRR